MITLVKRIFLLCAILAVQLLCLNNAVARGEFSLPFADAEIRKKTLLVLPTQNTLKRVIDGVPEDLIGEAQRFEELTIAPVLAGIESKGFVLTTIDQTLLVEDPELEALVAEFLEQLEGEMSKFEKEQKGVRYNWYRLGPAAYKLSKRFATDGVLIPRLAGIYAATSPSSGQLAGSIAKAGVMVALGGFSSISSNQILQDSFGIGLVFVDGESGYLDGVVYETSKLKRLLDDPKREDKVFKKMVKKMLRVIPSENKSLKLQIVTELYEMKQRSSFVDGSEDQMLKEIEQMLQD